MGVAPPTPYQWNVGDIASGSLLNAQLYNGLTFLLGPPAAIYQQNTLQSLPAGSFTSITWPTPVQDTYGGYAGANPTRYTPQQAGYYFAVGQVAWVPSATGGRTAALTKNGAANGAGIGQTSVGPPGSAYNAVVPAIGGGYFNGTTDYFELQSNQNSGGALNSVPGFTQLVVWMYHV